MVSSVVKKKVVAVVVICFLWSFILIRFSTMIQYLNEDDTASVIPLVTSKKPNNNKSKNLMMYERSSGNGGKSKQSPILLSEMNPPINDNDDTDDAKKVVDVAYAISITSCPIIIENVTSSSSYGGEGGKRNSNSASSRRRFAPTVFDGPAVLSQSIRSIHSMTETSKFTVTNESSIKDESGYNYDYTLYAFVLPSAAEEGCGSALESLGYNVLIRDIPFDVNEIGGTRNYRKKIETDSCCGSKEFLKLWAYSLAEGGGEDGDYDNNNNIRKQHEIVVHVDTDVFFVKPLNVLFDAMMISSSEPLFSKQEEEGKRQHHLLPPHIAINTDHNSNNNSSNINENNKRIDFFYTRDYLQENSNAMLILRDREQNKNNRNMMKAFRYTSSWLPVQGGFFIIRPNRRILNEMVETILEGEWNPGSRHAGKFNGFWGAYQIQGFLSYWYSDDNNRKRNEQQQNTVGTDIRRSRASTATNVITTPNSNNDHYHRSINAVELNPCIFNTMTHDRNDSKGQEKKYYDFRRPKCRTTPMEQIYSVHLTKCYKPWTCPRLTSSHPRRCSDLHRKWFEYRRSLELEWNRTIPIDGWHFDRTLGYCRRDDTPKILPNIPNKRYYVSLDI